jgi:RNA polymerase sigma-70 factor, ECF subfamily
MCTLDIQPAMNAAKRLPQTAGNADLCDERWLVEKAKSGHEDAFGELYKRHQLRAYRTALRILRNEQDAEDAVQRAFQRALVNLERFREACTFSTWLTRITINESLMLLRQRRTLDRIIESGGEAQEGNGGGVAIADARPSPEDIHSESERRAALFQAIGQLRESLRIIVLHRELKGLTSAETAKLLGLTVSAVKARTFHARRFLRKHLERKLVAQSSQRIGASASGK